MENGNGKMENGKWKMVNRKWKMENGKWKMVNGNLNSHDFGFIYLRMKFRSGMTITEVEKLPTLSI